MLASEGTMIRLLCICGKKLRVPREASAKASKGKCPACKAPFHFADGKWICLNSKIDEPEPPPREAVVNGFVATHARGNEGGEPQPVVNPTPSPVVTSAIDTSRTLEASGSVEDEGGDGATSDKPDREANTGAFASAGNGSALPSTIAVSPTSETVAVDGLQSTCPTESPPSSFGTHVNQAGQPPLAVNDPLSGEVVSAHVSVSSAAVAAAEAPNSNHHPQQLHREIRQSICESLRLRERYDADQADAISLACHPWPDQCLSRQSRLAIASELLPGFNANHPSFIEIAVDRLFRFAEAVTFEGEDALAIEFSNAARTLIESQTDFHSSVSSPKDDISARSVVASPLGVTVPTSSTPDAKPDRKDVAFDEGTDGADWENLVHSLLSGAYQTKSRDVGVICGGSAIGMDLDELASHLGVGLPEAAFDSLMNSISTRKLDILKSRTYTLGSVETLGSIKDRWGITRERVRQIETKAMKSVERQFADVFRGVGEQALQPLRNRVVRTSELHSAATVIAQKSEHAEMLAAFMLKLFGPWKQNEKWSVHESIADEVFSLDQSLALESDQYGFIEDDYVESTCANLFFSDSDRDEYLIEMLGLGHSFGNWTIKSTMKCMAASAIKKIGRPATKEELCDLMGLDGQRITNILGNIEGVARADRYRWGFIEWIDDVYDGIVGEIEQRIDAYNGSVPVHVLLDEIPSQFGVAEGSVRAYLASTAFVVENDMVRRSDGDEYSPRHPETCKDAVRVNDQWAYRSLIYDRHFNGYSLGVNFDVAFANGIRPGDDLVVPIEGADYEVSLIWRPHSLNRLVDVGRVSDFLKSEDYRAGDCVLILPSREGIKLIREDRDPELSFGDDGGGDAAESNGHVNKVSDPLLDLLGDF